MSQIPLAEIQNFFDYTDHVQEIMQEKVHVVLRLRSDKKQMSRCYLLRGLVGDSVAFRGIMYLKKSNAHR